MMERTDETIPSREELAVYIEEAAVSVTNNYEEAPAVLMVDDAVIGTLGNFSASIGKAKSKKTFNVSAIAASALSGRTEDFQRFGHCRISIEWPYCSSLPFHVPREQEEDSVYRHGAGTPSLSTGTEAHPAFGGNAG